MFVSFDLDHDNDCQRRLVDDVARAGSHFAVDDWSIRELADDWRDEANKRFSNVDLMFVICGEHTDYAPNVNNEIGIARNVGTPNMLLAGRPGSSKRPRAARDRDRVLDWKSGAWWSPDGPAHTRGTVR
ncbi:MAG: hypothetical protein ACLPVY_16785 [Acidimicrobiia bacterium]